MTTSHKKGNKFSLIRRYIIIEWIFGLGAVILVVFNFYFKVEEPSTQKFLLIIPFVFIIGGITTRILRKRLLKEQ